MQRVAHIFLVIQYVMFTHFMTFYAEASRLSRAPRSIL